MQFISKPLQNLIRSLGKKNRAAIEALIPKVSLEQKHISNCSIVLNRKSMLELIGKQDTVAELGVNRGEFSEEILMALSPKTFHVVDIWGSDRYHSGIYQEVMTKFSNQIESGTVKIHRKLSTMAASDFQSSYFDFIYIDTDHSYTTTRDELLAYASKMKESGIIAGHDYSMGNWIKSYRYGVIEAVHEFCVKHGWEIIYLTAEPNESQSFAIRKLKQ